MEDIERVRLFEIAELITKGTTPTTLGYEFQDDGVNFFKIECFDENGGFIENKVAHISEECHQKLKRSQLKTGDILFSIAGAIGRVAIVKEEMLPANTNQALAIIRISDEQIYLPYIKLILTSPVVIEQFETKKQGVAQLNLSLKDINEISIPLPSKDKQIEFVELFNKIAGVISKRNKELLSLDDLIKARFVEMFGDPVTNPKGYIKLTVAEAIEAGYIEKPFDGNHGSKHPKASEYVEAGIPFLMANNVMDGTVDLVNCSFITEARANMLDKGFAKDRDVLITHKGTIGRTAVLKTDCEFVMLTRQVAAYRVKKCIAPDYLCGYFATEFFQNDMKLLAAAGGSTRAYAGITAQLQLQLIIPPLNEQDIYTDFVNQVHKSKIAVQKALAETQTLFDSLMQKYFG